MFSRALSTLPTSLYYRPVAHWSSDRLRLRLGGLFCTCFHVVLRSSPRRGALFLDVCLVCANRTLTLALVPTSRLPFRICLRLALHSFEHSGALALIAIYGRARSAAPLPQQFRCLLICNLSPARAPVNLHISPSLHSVTVRSA